jgi:hypothetical protein
MAALQVQRHASSSSAAAPPVHTAAGYRERVAMLLSSRSAAHLKMGAAEAAAVDAAAAMVLLGGAPLPPLTGTASDGSSSPQPAGRKTDPLRAQASQAALRLASALLQLGWLPEAQAAVQEGLGLDPHNSELCDLSQRISLKLAAAQPELPAEPSNVSTSATGGKSKGKAAKQGRGASKAASGSTAGGPSEEPRVMTEREFHEMESRGAVGAGQLSMLNSMLEVGVVHTRPVVGTIVQGMAQHYFRNQGRWSEP